MCNSSGIKKYKSITKKKKTKLDKIVLLAKTKLNSIEVWISKALIDSNISHDECFLINNVLKEYGLFIKQCYCIIIWSLEKIQKVKIQNL